MQQVLVITHFLRPTQWQRGDSREPQHHEPREFCHPQVTIARRAHPLWIRGLHPRCVTGMTCVRCSCPSKVYAVEQSSFQYEEVEQHAWVKSQLLLQVQATYLQLGAHSASN